MRRALVTLALLATLTVPATASASKATDRADRALDRALQGLVGVEDGPPGVIAVVQRGADRSVHSAGVAELGAKAPPRARMQMRLASTAKAFSGAVALALVQKGELSLEDTIAELVPSLPAAWGEVTLQQVLSHTSGIPDFSKSDEFLDALVADPLHGPADQAELLTYIAGKPLSFEPGSRYRYSNSDNIVVALMVEAASGRSYRAALRREVLKPLGMRHTSLPRSAAMADPYMRGYDIDKSGTEDVSEIIDPNWTGASGGLVSTPLELNAFARGYVSGELFGSRVRRQQLELVSGHSEPPGPGRNRAGAAIFRYRTGCGTVFGHTGNTPGYTQFFAASGNGRRSVTVSATEQITPAVRGEVFKVLRRAEEKAVCAALAR